MSNTQQVTTTRTVTDTQQPSTANQAEELVLHLAPANNPPRVRWSNDTVDNEFAGKKKSKCCCIYKKTKNWNESSDEEDSDCETGHCRGHVEKRHEHKPEN
ncbi:hypothetical protein M3Y97_00229300 [Aphelenchoides bicaudatus]|nr:hypothetical protein M3Y97_00229300 [Aphelenchoides bicaudatus]